MNCARCNDSIKKKELVGWMGGAYHELCWRIWMSMWVMTQPNRQEALKLVDSIIGPAND